MTPTGLLRVGRRRLRLVVVIYALLAALLVTLPAALAQPRGRSTHPISDRR
jgi:hypothetical protein